MLRNFRTNESTNVSKSRNAKVTAVRNAWDGQEKEKLYQGAVFVISGSGVCDIRERCL